MSRNPAPRRTVNRTRVDQKSVPSCASAVLMSARPAPGDRPVAPTADTVEAMPRRSAVIALSPARSDESAPSCASVVLPQARPYGGHGRSHAAAIRGDCPVPRTRRRIRAIRAPAVLPPARPMSGDQPVAPTADTVEAVSRRSAVIAPFPARGSASVPSCASVVLPPARPYGGHGRSHAARRSGVLCPVPRTRHSIRATLRIRCSPDPVNSREQAAPGTRQSTTTTGAYSSYELPSRSSAMKPISYSPGGAGTASQAKGCVPKVRVPPSML